MLDAKTLSLKRNKRMLRRRALAKNRARVRVPKTTYRTRLTRTARRAQARAVERIQIHAENEKRAEMQAIKSAPHAKRPGIVSRLKSGIRGFFGRGK